MDRCRLEVEAGLVDIGRKKDAQGALGRPGGIIDRGKASQDGVGGRAPLWRIKRSRLRRLAADAEDGLLVDGRQRRAGPIWGSTRPIPMHIARERRAAGHREKDKRKSQMMATHVDHPFRSA